MRIFAPLLCSVAVVLSSRESPAAETRRVEYSGQLAQIDPAGADVPVRTFSLSVWIGDGGEVIYRVDDEGRGGLAWWERVGRQTRDADAGEDSPLPHLRHVHLDRPYSLRLPSPFPGSASLGSGSSWTSRWEGRRITYEVTGEQRRGDRNCWEVTGQTDTARRQTLLIDKDSGLLVSASLRVFMGQGDRFNLELDLEQETALSAEQAEAELRVAAAVISLQKQLGVDPDSSVGELTPGQLATIEQSLPALQQTSADTSWKRFVESMSADIAADRRRNQSVAALAARRLGKPAPELTLLSLDGRPIDLTAAAGKPIVLHFWEYRGSPESPFGQVGYLDFLSGQLKGDGVQVYGVAVDERLADRSLTPVVRREVQKFSREFIRVSYPIALDDGALLARFGDPRPLETPLPLWVVIAPDGSVAHFHAGLYTIDPNRGLEQLRDVLGTLDQRKSSGTP